MSVWRVLALGAALCAVLLGAQPFRTPGRVQPPPRGFGVALGYNLGGGRELGQLGPVWYLDFNYADPRWAHHRRLYLVGLEARLEQVARVARQARGEWWTLGNEPNDPHQDNLAPSAYVEPYHDFYFALKAADAQARVIPTAVANADWRWLDAWREKYRAAYGRYPLVDGWSFHNHLLETCAGTRDLAEFKRRALEFRNWVERIGAGARPILLTEYGVLYGNGCCGCPEIPDADVVEFMRGATRWLQTTRIVDAWAWFAVETGGRYNGDLFRDAAPTTFGTVYRELMEGWH